MTVNVAQIEVAKTSPASDIRAVRKENAKLLKQLQATQSKLQATKEQLVHSRQSELRLQQDIEWLKLNYQVATNNRDLLQMTFAESEQYWTSQMNDMGARNKQLLKIIENDKNDMAAMGKRLNECHLKWTEMDSRIQNEIVALTLGVQERLRKMEFRSCKLRATLRARTELEKGQIFRSMIKAHSGYLDLAKQFEIKSASLQQLIVTTRDGMIAVCEERGVDPLTQGLLSCNMAGFYDELLNKRNSLRAIQLGMQKKQTEIQKKLYDLRNQLGIPEVPMKGIALTAMTQDEYFKMVKRRYKEVFQVDLAI